MSISSTFIGKVFDNYRILENLGVGGMGVVFKAIHIKLDKVFALKMIAPALVMNENFIRRFQGEAKSLAKLEDPNIVRIYDLRSHNDQWFIVMEYVDGINLLQKIKSAGAFTWQQAIPILRQMLNAIGHAHNAGIIHRDIKPNNVMLTQDGLIKITDFGLAKDQTSLSNSQTAASGGTLYYMSPEQVRGLSTIDQRSDIYSAGMTFYEMITGNVPFKDITSDFELRETIVKKKLKKPSSFNPDLPSGLENIVMKSIAKNPDDRYQSAGEMLEAIDNFIGNYNYLENQEPTRQAGSRSWQPFIKILTPAREQYNKSVTNTSSVPWNKIMMIAATLVILLLTFILFYSRSWISGNDINETIAHLSISSDPGRATVYLNSDSIGQTTLINHAVSPGNYMLHVMNPDYGNIDTSITVNPGNHLDLSFVFREKIQPEDPGKSADFKKQSVKPPLPSNPVVTVRSDPADAILWINGQIKGRTPCKIWDLEKGMYVFKLQRDGYKMYENDILINQNKTQIISATLLPLKGELHINTNPDSALVFIDGQKIFQKSTPVTLRDILVGDHKIEIRKSGYASVLRNVRIRADTLYSMNLKLQKLEGKLTIRIRPWGSVYLNGELKAASADTRYELILPVGQYNVKVVHPTLGQWQKNIAVEAEDTNDILVDFNREYTLVVSALDQDGNPVNATIFLDNENTGKITPQTLFVKAGLHKLNVKKEGYISLYGDKKINIEQNLKEPQKFVLKKLIEQVNDF